MNRSFQICLACAFGAAIGTFVALQLSPLFLWIGPLIGGILGYLLFDPREVKEKIPIAFRRVCKPIDWVVALTVLLAISLVTLWLGVVIGTFAGTIWIFSLFGDPYMLGPFLSIAGIVTTLIYFEIVFYSEELTIPGTVCKLFLLAMIPINLVLVIRPVWIFLKDFIPELLPAFRSLFRLIHSNFRLLCLCDAMIGATIGYFAGNVLIGAIAGGVIGLVNYELISKRWLKLAV